MSKFQIIFLHVKYENSKWKSLLLFNSSFAVGTLQLSVGRLQLSVPKLFLAHDAAVHRQKCPPQRPPTTMPCPLQPAPSCQSAGALDLWQVAMRILRRLAPQVIGALRCCGNEVYLFKIRTQHLDPVYERHSNFHSAKTAAVSLTNWQLDRNSTDIAENNNRFQQQRPPAPLRLFRWFWCWIEINQSVSATQYDRLLALSYHIVRLSVRLSVCL